MKLLHAALSSMACLVALPSDAAESYPSRPVRLVIPFSPGGAADVPGRMVAQKLSELLGQQVIADNRALRRPRIR